MVIKMKVSFGSPSKYIKHPGVEILAYQEGNPRGCGDPRNQTYDRFPSFLIFPKRCWWQPSAYPKEKDHSHLGHKGNKYHLVDFSATKSLVNDVCEKIGDRIDQNRSGSSNGSQSKIELGYLDSYNLAQGNKYYIKSYEGVRLPKPPGIPGSKESKARYTNYP